MVNLPALIDRLDVVYKLLPYVLPRLEKTKIKYADKSGLKPTSEAATTSASKTSMSNSWTICSNFLASDVDKSRQNVCLATGLDLIQPDNWKTKFGVYGPSGAVKT